MGSAKYHFLKITENFLQSIAAIPFVQEVATLLKMGFVEYIVYRTLKPFSIV